MKNTIYTTIILTVFFISNIVHGQQYSCLTYTPNGTRVYLTCYDDEPLSSAQIATFNQQAEQMFTYAYRWGNASGKYNCHSYAWWWTSSNSYAWMNSPNDDKYWLDGSYSLTNWSQATRISYVNGDHSARNYPGYLYWAYSKWGKLPRMIHSWNNAPYNTSSMNVYKKN